MSLLINVIRARPDAAMRNLFAGPGVSMHDNDCRSVRNEHIYVIQDNN